MIHTVQIFSVVNETEVVVFLELPCFLSFNYLMNVGNLVSGSSASLNVYTRNSIPIFSPQSYTITFIIFVSYFFLCCFFKFQLFMLNIFDCTLLLIFSYHCEISPYPSPEDSFYFPHLDLLLLATVVFLCIGFVFQRHISLSVF